MNIEAAQEREAAAGEYVLGTLDAADRAAFEEALAGDAGLQALVYRWQDRLLPLSLRIAPAEPDATGWAAIEARVVRRPTAVGVVAPQVRRGTEDAANDPHLVRRLRVWQTLAGFALAACVVLALLLVRAPGAPAERYLALLQAPGEPAGQTGWIVEVTAGRNVRLVPVAQTDTAVPPGKALQFWTKLEGAAAPTSLGLVPPGRATELPAARLPGLAQQQLFELTLEPEAGSPIGRPTGPVLYVGRSFKL